METNECNNNESQLQDSKACMSRHTMNNLNDMRNSNTLCDASIKLDDESKFNVHRNILSACSLYFRALFTTSITDENSNVYISGISKMAMQNILDFAYLRECKIDEDNVYEMLTISDYVGMMGLVKNCCDFMISMLTPKNCIEVHLFSKVHNYHNLPNISKQYILQHFVEVAAESTQIVKMDLEDFYEIISNDKLNTKSEETVWECCLRWIDFDRINRIKNITILMGCVRLGLLSSTYFKEQVRNHPYVINSEEAKPIIIETLSFLYDLDTMSMRHGEMATPTLAIPRIPHEVIFAIGGWSEGVPQKLIESYDTRADRWNRVLLEDPAGPRAYHGTAVIKFEIYCIGGYDGVEYFNTCRVFNAFYKTWNQISPMHHRRCYVSVTELNGLIYAMGGYDGVNRQNSVERYDPSTNQWTLLAPMIFQRSDADSCTCNGQIFMVGGFNGTECLSSCECYDSDSNRWSLIPEMFTRRSGVGCVSLKGLIYVIGGFNGLSRIRTCERYDPETQMWSLIKEMYSPRSNFGIEIIDDMIFAIGGFNGVVTISHTECYVVETDEWLEATDMTIIRSALTATVLKDLPNIKEYIHQNREKLMEERRLRLISAHLESTDEEILEEEEEEEELE